MPNPQSQPAHVSSCYFFATCDASAFCMFSPVHTEPMRCPRSCRPIAAQVRKGGAVGQPSAGRSGAIFPSPRAAARESGRVCCMHLQLHCRVLHCTVAHGNKGPVDDPLQMAPLADGKCMRAPYPLDLIIPLRFRPCAKDGTPLVGPMIAAGRRLPCLRYQGLPCLNVGAGVRPEDSAFCDVEACPAVQRTTCAVWRTCQQACHCPIPHPHRRPAAELGPPVLCCSRRQHARRWALDLGRRLCAQAQSLRHLSPAVRRSSPSLL